jgi:RimJ/RimL family protein N-acetyltransferase
MGFMGLTFAFRELGALQVIGEVLGSNERSVEFHRKLGFTYLGRREPSPPGTERVLIFQLSAKEWEVCRDAVRLRVIKGRPEFSWLT